MIERLPEETRNIAKAMFVHDGIGGKLNGMWMPPGFSRILTSGKGLG
jgi:hypothetical protein